MKFWIIILIIWAILDIIGFIVIAVGIKNAPLMPDDYDQEDGEYVYDE